MFLWWRAFYGVMNSRWFVWLLRGAIRLTDRVKPGAALTWLELRVGEAWPLRIPGWVNVHISELLWSLRRRHVVQPGRGRRTPRTGTSRLRVGCLGAFSGLLGFPTSLFEAFPRGADLHIYDLQYKGQLAHALRTVAPRYQPFNLETSTAYQEDVGRVVAAITRDDLDLLLVIRSKRDVYDILDHLRTPCIAHVCTGSDVLHHPQVDFDLYCQPEAGFFPVGRELFCEFTRSPVKGHLVQPASLCFDRRNLDIDADVPSWEQRSPLIVFHGSLYKLASDAFLECLFGIVAAHSDVEFAFMGKDWADALARIDARARRWGVGARVHYEGTFSAMRNADGVIDDAGWLRLLDLLKRARLAPDPWPVGGASSRFEAYVMGVPTVHMGLRTDPASWGRPHPGVFAVPNLLVPQATAYSVEEYQAIATSCLTDPAFADAVAATQRATARAASDPDEYWSQVFRAFDEWRSVDRGVVAEVS
jgi:hypothetical protein